MLTTKAGGVGINLTGRQNKLFSVIYKKKSLKSKTLKELTALLCMISITILKMIVKLKIDVIVLDKISKVIVSLAFIVKEICGSYFFVNLFKRQVQVYKLISKSSIDETLLKIQAKKLELDADISGQHEGKLKRKKYVVF